MSATGHSPRRLAPRAWIVIILLLAAALRLAALDSAPPGMTHDEADHGLTAWRIVNGAREVYFTIGYGREPLYDYATAVVMLATGPSILAARLTSAGFSLLLIAATHAWARRAFGAPVALLAAAGLAAGFWPLMTARQALRSITLPALFALAVLFFWQGVMARRGARHATAWFLLAGAVLGLTAYTYLPARVLWLALPLLAGYVWLGRGAAGRSLWPGVALTLLVAALVAAPLAIYLATNPELEVRVSELSAPLRAAAGGDFGPLWANATASLRLLTLEGDATWRYNIPGRPFLPGPLGWLFYAGLVMAAWLAVGGRRAAARLRLPAAAAPGAFLALAWLALGLAPVLVTGPGLSTTQAIGAQPAVFLLAALPLGAAFGWAGRGRRWAALAAVLLVAGLAVATARDYFGRWANAPEVRVQYETTMITALRYLDGRGGAAAVSTVTPGPFHTPAVALLTLRNPTVEPRWFDGRESLLLPGDGAATLLIPGFTPVPAALQPYLATATLVEELPLRPDDLDRPVRVYSIAGPPAVAAALARMKPTDDDRATASFGEHATWLGYDLATVTARPGDSITLVTGWRLEQPLPGAALFAHVGAAGDGPAAPLAQADSLGAPGEQWLAGDTLLQLHTITLPEATAPGSYPLLVGVYTRPDGARLPLAGGGDQLTLTTLTVLPPDTDG